MSTMFEELAEQSVENYRELLVDVAEGVERDPAEALQVAIAAGKSAAQLATDSKRVCELRDATKAAENSDLGEQIEEARQAVLTTRDAAATAEAARLRAIKEHQTAVQAAEAAVGHHAALNRQRTEQQAELRSLLRKNCEDTNRENPGHPVTWKDFVLK